MDSVNPETLRNLRASQELLHSLLDDCGVKLERLQSSRDELRDSINEFRGEYLRLSGVISSDKKRQLQQQLENAQQQARQFDAEINNLRSEYNKMLDEYSYLIELGT